MTFPHPNEYAPVAGVYVQRIAADTDIFALLAQQPDDLRTLLQNIPDEQANVRPAPGEWSIKEVVGHLCDAERNFAYRATCIARGDTTHFPGYEQEDYVRNTDFNARSLPNLIAEFTLQRRSNILCLQPLTGDELARWGTARSNPVTPRAILYIMAGHVLHHMDSLKTDYHVG